MTWREFLSRRRNQDPEKQPSFFKIARALNSDEARRLAKEKDLEGLTELTGLEGETRNYDTEKAELDKQYEAGLLTKKEYRWKCRVLWSDFHW